MTADNPTPNQPDTGDIREQIKLLIDKHTYAVLQEGKAYPGITRETLADEHLALFADKLAGLLEQSKTIAVYSGTDSLTPAEHITAIPVSAVERLLEELKS